jgi:GWxTD domain-containing protein
VKYLLSILYLVVLFNFECFAQRFGNRYLRLPLSENCKTLLINEGGKQKVFINASFGENEGFNSFLKNSDRLELHWNIKNGPDEPVVFLDSIPLNDSNFEFNSTSFNLSFSVPKLPADITQFLTLRIINPDNNQSYVMYDRIYNVNTITYSFYPRLNNQKFPLQNQFCSINDTLKLISYPNDSILVTYFPELDSLALPPMFLGSNPYVASNNFKRFKVKSNTPWVPQQIGLYVISDLYNSSKYSIVVHNSKFPTFTKVKELISALHYITTDQERENLLTAQNQKEILDEFLINLTGDKVLAKNIVKSYFKRVFEANNLFTSSKEGWKTDKGMVYIIFGKPDKVYYENGHEDWSYEKNPLYNELNFYFQVKNTDKGYVYELERLKDYNEIWIAIIEKWRRGSIK